MFLDTLNGDTSLFTDHVPINKKLAVGEKDVVGYKASVPSFCPPGEWTIVLTIKDQNDQSIAILKAHFTVE